MWAKIRPCGQSIGHFGCEYPASFSILVEWLYKDRIEAPSQCKTKKAARAAVEAYIYLAYLASKYNIKGLSNAAVEQLGVCYLVNGILASRAEMREVFDYCYTSSLIGKYMVHTFRELLIRSPGYDPITSQDRADMSSSNAWVFAKVYGEVGNYVFEFIGIGRLEIVPPRRQLICFCHQHGPDAICASRGKTFGEQIRSLECTFPY